MTRPVKYRQPYIRPDGTVYRILAEILRPRRTVIISRDGYGPGEAVPPEEWAAAYWDPKREAWVVPDAPLSIA